MGLHQSPRVMAPPASEPFPAPGKAELEALTRLFHGTTPGGGLRHAAAAARISFRIMLAPSPKGPGVEIGRKASREEAKQVGWAAIRSGGVALIELVHPPATPDGQETFERVATLIPRPKQAALPSPQITQEQS